MLSRFRVGQLPIDRCCTRCGLLWSADPLDLWPCQDNILHKTYFILFKLSNLFLPVILCWWRFTVLVVNFLKLNSNYLLILIKWVNYNFAKPDARDRHTDRQTDRQTETETEIYRERRGRERWSLIVYLPDLVIIISVPSELKRRQRGAFSNSTTTSRPDKAISKY